MSNELYHHGILGMKWGVRRSENQLARARGKQKKDPDSDVSDKKETSTKKLHDMSDEELHVKIAGLEKRIITLEKRYADLSKTEQKEKQNKGKQFVMSILEKSGQNIGTQFTTYAMGTAVNKLAGAEIVNPKKGQKDK